MAGRQPEERTLVAHHRGEVLVPGHLAREEDRGVRHLVQHDTGHLEGIARQAAGEDRVGQPAERRVGAHATQQHVQVRLPQPGRLRLCLGAVEEAQVGDAADHREPPAVGLQAVLGRGGDVPGHRVVAGVVEGAVEVLARQTQALHAEAPGRQQHPQGPALLGRAVRVVQDLGDRAAGEEDLRLAAALLEHVAAARRQRQRGEGCQTTPHATRRRSARAPPPPSRPRAGCRPAGAAPPPSAGRTQTGRGPGRADWGRHPRR